MDLIVGGEGISEPLRTHLLQFFQTVISSYGASDLEINIGVETELTINLRRLCMKEPRTFAEAFRTRDAADDLSVQRAGLHHRDDAGGRIIFTIGRQTSAAPKIRYNLHDLGGTMTHKELSAKLAANGIDVCDLAKRQSRFPILFVYGRSDLTVPFYGAKVYPTDIEEIINAHPKLVKQINSFQIASYEDEAIDRRLKIRLETIKDLPHRLAAVDELHQTFFEGLCRVNQDFREVTKMFDRSCVEIEIYRIRDRPV